MDNKEIYYVYVSDNGFIGRVAKFVDGHPYGYDEDAGDWVFMPGLVKIKFDITDYEEITKEQAERLIHTGKKPGTWIAEWNRAVESYERDPRVNFWDETFELIKADWDDAQKSEAVIRYQATLKAKYLAREHFAGRTDKAGADYFRGHLCSVAALVESPEEKTTAYLHDILEDTDYPEEELRKEFGNQIVDAILMVTHKGHLDEEGYLDYIRKLKKSGNQLAIAVKIADLTNNSDYTRMGASSPDELPEKDRKRWEKYQKSLEILKS